MGIEQSFDMPEQETKGRAQHAAQGSNSTQPTPLLLAHDPRARFRSLIDTDFSSRHDAALEGFDAATTGPGALSIHPLTELQKINSRLYAKFMARKIFYDLRSCGIVEVPDVDPFSGADIEVEVNFPEGLPAYEDVEKVVVAMSKFKAWAYVYDRVQARMTWLEIEDLLQKRLRVEWETIEAEGYEMLSKEKGTYTIWYPKTT